MAAAKMRHIRIDDVWERALKKAHAEGTDLAKVIREFLDDYVNEDASAEDELRRIIQRLIILHGRIKIGDEE